MITIVLVVLGVPVAMLLGSIGGALWSRRRNKAQPGMFRVKTRKGGDWPRRDTYAQLIHDVIVFNEGLALARTTVRGVSSATVVSVLETPPADFDSVVRLDFDDGETATIAIEEHVVDHFHALAHGGVGDTGGAGS